MEQPALTEELNSTVSIKDQMIKLKMIKEKIDDLYNQQKELIKDMLKGHEKLSGHIFIPGLDKPYMRVSLTDNKKVFESEESVFRMATVNRYESKIEFLKNEPKEK